MAGSGTIPPFGHGSGSPFGNEAGVVRMSRWLAEHRRSQGGHRPPKRPKGPRFGMLRRSVSRVVRVIRGGGD